jgi:hypothetical protein
MNSLLRCAHRSSFRVKRSAAFTTGNFDGVWYEMSYAYINDLLKQYQGQEDSLEYIGGSDSLMKIKSAIRGMEDVFE